MKKIAFIDTETTGLQVSTSEHEVIEFCIILNGVVTTHKVKPSRLSLAHPKALEINGYNEKDWEDALSKEEAAKIVADLLCKKGVTPCGHNIQFDINGLNALLKEGGQKKKYLTHRSIDTQTLAIVYLMPTGLKSVSMDNIRKWLGWDLDKAHTAEKDTLDCMRLYSLLSTWNPLKRLWWSFMGKRNMKKLEQGK